MKNLKQLKVEELCQKELLEIEGGSIPKIIKQGIKAVSALLKKFATPTVS